MVKTLDKAGASTQSNPVKRKKVDDDDSNPASKKRSRVSFSFSCGECHRRKQKCDRQVPCSHCVARKVPDLCKAYTPGKTEQDISVRLARIEHIIEMALPQYCMPTTPNSSFDPHISEFRQNTLEEDNSQPEDQDPSGGTFQSGKWYGNSASGSIAPGTILEQLQNAFTSTDAEDKRLRRDVRLNDISVNGSSHLSATAIVGSELEPTAADNLKNLVQECGVSPHKISELLHELPPLRTSQVLIDYYFKSVNWTRYPISERDFRDAYSSIYNGGDHGISATNPHDVRFLPLLFVVLAIAVRLAPEDVSGDARTRRVTSLRYYWSSRRSLLIAAAIQPDSLDIVLTRLLSARFLTFDRRITECWSQLGAAVRTAQALGLHRDGASMGMEPHLVEYRRRIWSYLYHADRSYALVLGRPNSIQDTYTSTLPPSNIDDETLNRPTPLSSPTPMTFVILRHQLASIIGRIAHHFQQVKPSHYSEVTALDDELLNFIANLPPHFALEPDRSLDETHTYIPVHRYLLITEIMFVRTSLHRPYILRRLSSDRYARSREACFESALKDFQVRQAFREVQSKEVRDSLSNAYREFQTAMISGIYLVLHPAGKDEAAMHAILDSFMKEHEGIRDMDETTRRELKTIEFLKNKASQRTLPNAIGSLPPNDPAHLLLGLQQSSTPHPPPFPSLLNLPSASSPRSPYATHINQSPTFQRLQSTSGDFENSPTASGSPNGEEDSAAQSLLDHWCNAISAPLEGSSSASSWGGLPGNFAGWAGTTSTLVGAPDPRILAGIDGNEWNYWETLVNQIRGPAPGPS
ncbi:fungal-specific transcription factor domain-containing protein [Armillaria borealis]|uniref:Fungal-specific transcription factor domain-containing protein n=1 Tax=Armillaria borealis TaxID=47425 RepID=A0AA39K5W6_9AGAR|nr:fungal-specific transcription factor domain-containing protein [Armillaria borealis]